MILFAIVLAAWIIIAFASTKQSVDQTVQEIHAQAPDQEPVHTDAWADSGCLVLLLVAGVALALPLIGAMVALPE